MCLSTLKWNKQITKKFATDLLIYTNTDDNLLNIITTASANNVLIDSINTITKSEFKIYAITIMVENTDILDKFCKDLNNLGFVNKVERQVN